LRQNT